MTESDDEYQGYDFTRKDSSWKVYAVMAVIAATVVGSLYIRAQSTVLSAAFLPDENYDAAVHEPVFLDFMKKSFPQYLIAASTRNDAKRAAAAKKMLSACEAHAGLQRHAAVFVEAVDDFYEWSEKTTIQSQDQARDGVGDVDDAFDALEEMLRDIGAPFSVDASVIARRKGPKWNLSVLARTSRVLKTTTFELGGDEFEVLRVERIDNLSLRDLVHGKAKNGRALVLDDNARELALNRWVTAISAGEIRSFGKKARSRMDQQGMEESIRKMVPERLRGSTFFLVSARATGRRSALETIDQELKKHRSRLIQPKTFWMSKARQDRLTRRIDFSLHPNLAKQLSLFIEDDEDGDEGGDEDRATAREEIEAVWSAVTEVFLKGVDRHEAWHLVNPDPTLNSDKIHPGAATELFAYTGAIADADDDLPLLLDSLFQKSEIALSTKRKKRTGTDVAVMALAGELLAFSGLPFAERLVASRERARVLMKEWFDEDRRMVRVGTVDGVPNR